MADYMCDKCGFLVDEHDYTIETAIDCGMEYPYPCPLDDCGGRMYKK